MTRHQSSERVADDARVHPALAQLGLAGLLHGAVQSGVDVSGQVVQHVVRVAPDGGVLEAVQVLPVVHVLVRGHLGRVQVEAAAAVV